MARFFEMIYGWFVRLYGVSLDDFLLGADCPGGDILNSSKYGTIGMITSLIAIFIVVLFYFIINSPRFKRWWCWFLMFFINFAIAFSFGFGTTSSADIPGCFFSDTDTCIYVYGDFLGFGFANALVGAIVFLLFSIILKRFSTNCMHVPFKSLWHI